MKIELDIYGPRQLRALATFATALAEEQEKAIGEKLAMVDLYESKGVLVGATAAQNFAPETAPSPEQVAAKAEAETAPAPTRERGKPSPGRARRTKEEIAEDDAYEATQTRATPPESVPAISETPEDRQDPNNPEPTDSEADAEQDAADEAAETAANATEGVLTLDNVRNKLGEYVKKFGMEAAQADGPVLIAKVLGVEPDPKAPKKISDLGDDQALIARAVAGVDEMLTRNPFKRTAVA